MLRGLLLGLVVALLTSCVGYVHLGGRKSRPDVYIGMDGTQRLEKTTSSTAAAAARPSCPPYVFVVPAPLGALPEFDGSEPEKEVIERLGRALVRTRTQYTDYARIANENYQAYLLKCSTGGT